jgi:hypothetical protein
MEKSKPIERDQWNHRTIHERFQEFIAGIAEPLL